MTTPEIRYDEFGFFLDDETEANAADPIRRTETETQPETPHTPMRLDFPPAGAEYMGGQSDGWEYRSIFAGGTLEKTYEMVRRFLTDEGYGDLPLPANAAELRLFRKPRHPQLSLFEPRGYVHNPIKILFPTDKKVRNALILCIYNENSEGHLPRFHGVAK